jgi:hypothetical protein
VVRDQIFEEPEFEILPSYQKQVRQTIKKLLHCYRVAKEEEPTKDNPCNI